MPPRRGLAHGRPNLQGPANQFIDERRRSVPAQNGWVLSAQMSQTFPELTSTAFSANLLTFARLPILSRDYELVRAVANITAGAASSYLRAGIYVYSSEGKRPELNLVAGSGISFPAASTGRQAVDFNSPVTLYANGQYFLGSMVTDAAIGAVAAQGNTNLTEAVLTYSTAVLPSRLLITDTSKSYTTAAIPLVTYYSAEAKLVVS